MGWDAYQLADRIIALTPWEASLMERILGASPEQLKVVPNGVAREFLESKLLPRGEYLVVLGRSPG